MTVVPVAIIERTDAEMQQLGYIENKTQLPLSYWEEALFFGQLRDDFGFSFRSLATHLNVSKGYVQNRLDLLKLPADSPIRQAASEGALDLKAALTLQSLMRSRPPAQIDELLAQHRAGTLAGRDLTRLLKETGTQGDPAVAEAVVTVEDQHGARPSLEPCPVPGSEFHGSIGVGRFADLVLTDDSRAGAIRPHPDKPFPFPCGQDDEWLIETGRMHPDGTETELVDPATQATHELLRLLRRQIPRLEELVLMARVEILTFRDRAEFAELLRRMFAFGEAARIVDVHEPSEGLGESGDPHGS